MSALVRYYESYRKSVMEDSLPNFAEFAKNTPTKSSQFETFFDYLTYVTEHINIALNEGSRPNFFRWLREHQYAISQLFGEMVKTYQNPFEYGWKSYKFSDHVVVFDKFTLIPNPLGFSERKIDRPVIFGGEMESVIQHPSRENIAEKFLALKGEGHCFLQLEKSSFKKYDLLLMNKEFVVNWMGVI